MLIKKYFGEQFVGVISYVLTRYALLEKNDLVFTTFKNAWGNTYWVTQTCAGDRWQQMMFDDDKQVEFFHRVYVAIRHPLDPVCQRHLCAQMSLLLETDTVKYFSSSQEGDLITCSKFFILFSKHFLQRRSIDIHESFPDNNKRNKSFIISISYFLWVRPKINTRVYSKSVIASALCLKRNRTRTIIKMT